MRYLCLLSIYFLLFISCLQAQTIKGRVMEYQTRIKLTGVRIENLTTRQSSLTDNEGLFSIKAEKNQLLVFNVLAYQPDTVLITGNNNLEVFLSLQTRSLNIVNVNANTGPASFAYHDPNFHGQTVAYQTDANGFLKGGLSFRFWYWKKDERKRKRREKLQEQERQEAQIAQTFNPKTLTKYLPLQGREMQHFINLYTPPPEIYFDNNFNLVLYIQKSYKEFNQLPANKRQLMLTDTLKTAN